MVKIDGSYGEGGGQILRSSLSLSLLTGQSIEIFNIRVKRKNPGIQRQHLVAVEACQKISNAKVSGANLGSKILRFEPKKIKPGYYEFDIGTAGSTTLVAQTILLPLSFSHQPSEILLIGGTHNPLAPSFHYFNEIFLPVVSQLGLKCQANLEKWGFYPKGGGRIRIKIWPTQEIKAKDFLERGDLKEISGISVVANLPLEIAERQKKSAEDLLKKTFQHSAEYQNIDVKIKTEQVQVLSPGAFIFLKARFKNIIAGFSALGERGKLAERVGEEVTQKFLEYFQSQKTLDPYLADQIIPYLVLSKTPFSFTTSKITNHLLTHIWLIEKFLNCKIGVNQKENKVYLKYEKPI